MVERSKAMKKFEVGKSYEWYQRENGSVEVLRRSAKFITVRNDFGNSWRMLIRVDENGDEFAIDSTVPSKWRDAFTVSAE